MTHARTQHPNAVLTPKGRRRMVDCVLEQGWTIEATAERFQVDAKTVRKWRDRFLAEGDAGLRDRSIAAASLTEPNVPAARRREVLRLRKKRRWGADHIGSRDRSGRVDGAEHPEPPRAWADSIAVTGPRRNRFVRYQRDRPGELIHVDIKKIAGDPRRRRLAHPRPRQRPGQRPLRRRLPLSSTPPSMTAPGIVYSEIHDDEQAVTAVDVLAPSRRLVRFDRHRRRTGPHRQRVLLPHPGSGTRARRAPTRPETHPPLPAPNQRQDRTLPPDPARGMGLHPRPGPQRPNASRLRRLHPLLQSPPIPRRTRLGHTDRHPHQPRGQPPRHAHLAVIAFLRLAAGGRR